MPVTTENTVKPPVQSETKTDKLNALDRCDKCGAQAFVEATLTSGNNLMFCNHHWLKVEVPIKPYIKDVVDERWKLTYNRHKGTENS